MNIHGKDTYLPLTYEDFLNGYSFFVWNLTPDYHCEPQNPAKRANIRLDLKFSEATPSSMNVILYCVFDSMITIDGSGTVQTVYN